ncbi:aminoglycoside 6-adenylyltransferase [Anaerococcus sp. NML200574]|uniref:aminoglycoside 6-adenylyltransferase n=1 Tax=Anaerococcus sp. NML200574 TaxID=2954486 RepID=UPI0022378DD2|nr:aminoglycoside 6-adenylyltransferase [Anaerococcus sp. NML200574]MCW6678791.1 aminoglycoside 6-adenylyltransferase [Anaerococcus sp. NML200574]
MRNDISQRIKDYANKNESIESIFYVKRYNNDEFYHIYTVVNNVIIGKLEEEFESLFEDMIFSKRSKDIAEIDKNKFTYTTIDLYKEDDIKISESIISSDIAESFIKTLPNDIEFLYNKPGSERLAANDDYSLSSIKEYEFEKTVKNFFAYAIEVSLYLKENNYLAASIKMNELRNELINMLRIHVINKFNGKRDIGKDGREFTHTLVKEYKDDLEDTFHDINPLNIYNSLFKACILFRKIGMQEADVLGFSYDRAIDVKTLKLLRDNYKKLESFLN